MEVATLRKTLQGHKESVQSVAFSPDGKLLASSASADDTVRLWNIPNGDLNAELKGHESGVRSVAFSPDGKSIVTGSWDKTVRTWSVETKKQIQILNGHSDFVRSVAWSPNGDVIASGSKDTTVILWDAISGSAKKKLTHHTREVYSISFSQNGNKIASAGWDKTAIIWDVNSGAALIKFAHSTSVRSVCFSHDDQFVVTSCNDNIVRMFNANTGHEEKRFEGHTGYVESVAISFDGSTIASGSWDKSVRLWDVASTKQLQQLDEHTKTVTSIAFSNDGKFIASGSGDKIVRLWNAPSSLQAEAERKAKEAESRAQEAERKKEELRAQQAKADQQKQEEELRQKDEKTRKKLDEAAELERRARDAEERLRLAEQRARDLEAKAAAAEAAASSSAPAASKQILPKPVSSERNKSEKETQQKQATLDLTQVAEWSVDDVCGYFKQAKISDDVVEIFRKERIKGKSLASKAKDEVLKSMGVNAMGDREDVIDAINKLVSATGAATSTPSTSSGGNSFIIYRHELNIRDITLGSGFFGKVMLADYKGMPVALKQSKVSDVDKYQEFVNEALTMKRLPPHDFVVNCVGLCMTDNEAFVVLELCKGSLLDRLRDTSQPPLGSKQRLEILHKMAQGMDHLCQHQILHGDFACRNVLYQLGGGQIVPKVSDFGGARKITPDKTYYSVRGKNIALAWTAPEVFSSHHCDHQSDVFSFGVAMWEVYTNGAAPHADKQPLMIPGFVTTPSNYPLLPKPPQCPNDAYDLINRCMALEPKHRPTFAQIAAQLSQMLANI